MILARHVAQITGARVLAALGVLLGLLLTLQLLEVATEVLARGLGAGGVVRYLALRLPSLTVQALPLAVLAGALFAFAGLARTSVVSALRAAGVSGYRVAAFALPAALAAAALQLALSLWIAPRTEAALDRWWRASAPRASRAAEPAHVFRYGDEVVRATMDDAEGRRLRDLTLYRRDPAGRLVQRTQAARADLRAQGGWTLTAVRVERYGENGGLAREQRAEAVWPAPLAAADVRRLAAADPAGSAESARRALSGGASWRSSAADRTALQCVWAAPAASVVMLLLAAPAALGDPRRGRSALLVGGGVAAGLLFLVADGLFTALGESGVVAPFLAAWLAPALFAAAGVTALLHLEG